MKKLCCLALCTTFTFTSLFGIVAQGADLSPRPGALRDNLQGRQKEIKDQIKDTQQKSQDQIKELRNDIKETRGEIQNEQNELKNLRGDLREPRPQGVPGSVYRDTYQRKDDMKDRREDMKDRRDDLKNTREEMKDKRDDLKNTREELKDKMESVREDIYKKRQGVRDDVYKIHQNKDERKAMMSELRDRLKEIRKDQKDLRKELMREVVKQRRADNDHNVPVFVNGTDLEFDVPPMIKDNRVLIPVSHVAKALGAVVTWDGPNKTVTIVKSVYASTYKKDGVTVGNGGSIAPPTVITIVIKLDSNEVTVNGVKQIIDVPAFAKDGRTMVPFRFIATALNKIVDYDKDSGSVIIDDND